MAVFKDGQKLHSGLAVNELMTGMIQQGEYAVLMRFFTNNPTALDLGYQEIKLEEPQRLEWLHKVRQAAGDGSPQGLMNALTCLQELISPMADSFTPISVVAQRKLDKLEIQFKETQKKKKDNLRNRVEELMKDPAIVAATTEDGGTIHASGEKDNLFACQFHPEKSGEIGLTILKNFVEM